MSDAMSDATLPRSRRGGGRSGNARRSGASIITQAPWSLPRYHDNFTEPLTADQLQAIHNAACTMLEDVGIELLHDQARDHLRRAGAIVEGTRVRIGREIVEHAVSLAPSEIAMRARNPARDFTFGGRNLVFAPVASAPNAFDMERGRRTGNRADYQDFLRLTQMFNVLHLTGGYPCEPCDIHPSVRHLDALYDVLTLTDRCNHIYSLGEARVEDGLEMVRIAHGVDHAEFAAHARCATIINTNSPLKIDIPMMDGAMRMAAKGQVTIITPFTLAGAMAPVTIAGAVAQQTAEFLAANAVLQLHVPGAKVIYGGFTSNVDMRSGAPAFGTPEYMRGAQMGGQMARFYRLPYRASNVNASNLPDAQGVWESVFSLWGVISGGVNMVMHAAGWQEGGLSAGFEKFVIDCELLQWITRYLQPVGVSDDELGLSAVREVGPGGHYFGCAHTRERYETAFYSPFLSDWRNFETFTEAGGLDATARAHRIYKAMLAEYEEPAIDPAIREELAAFVAKRKAQGGALTDF